MPWSVRQSWKRGAVWAVGLVAVGSVSGCIPSIQSGFNSPAPSKRLDAIVGASVLEDNESLVRLVEKLRSEVPAERMLAIRSLEIRTGTTLDYDHAAPPWQRLEGFNRWVEYLEEHGIEAPDLTDDGQKSEIRPMEQDAG